MIHHLIQPELVLSEMYGVCKPGGLILISDINDEGQRTLQAVHQQEWWEHIRLGWSMDQVKGWFEGKGCMIKTSEQPCEMILRIDQ